MWPFYGHHKKGSPFIFSSVLSGARVAAVVSSQQVLSLYSHYRDDVSLALSPSLEGAVWGVGLVVAGCLSLELWRRPRFRRSFQKQPVLEVGWWFVGVEIRWPSLSRTRKGISSWKSLGLGPVRHSPTSWCRRTRRRTREVHKAARPARCFYSSQKVSLVSIAAAAETRVAAGSLKGLQGCVCNFLFAGGAFYNFLAQGGSRCSGCVCARGLYSVCLFRNETRALFKIIIKRGVTN